MDALRDVRAARARAARVIPLPPHGDAGDRARAGRADGRDRAPPAGRRGRVHHAVQLPDREHGRQARPRARDGQHRRRAARVAEPARGDRARAASCTRSGSRPASSTSSPVRRPSTGEALVETRDIDMVSFTGSTGVGMRIGEVGGRTMKRLLLELGGKGARARVRRRRREDRDPDDRLGVDVPLRPDLHRADARDRAARRSTTRWSKASRRWRTVLKVGDPYEPDTVLGPVITAAHRDRVESYVAGRPRRRRRDRRRRRAAREARHAATTSRRR